jgi:hypothetical protein
VAKELALIAEVQTDEWWVDVTLPMLEQLRRRLRLLVPFIEKGKRKIVYTDFTDTLGEVTEIGLSGLVAVDEFGRFRRKTRQFLEEHKAHVAVEKLYRNLPITDTDLAELQRVLIETGVGTDGDMQRAVEEAGSFGVFIRGLVGLDRSAAKEAFAEFLDDKRYTANQIEFVNLVIDHLAEHGVIEARRFYESPFTDLSPPAPTPCSTPPTLTAFSPSSPTSGTTPRQPDDTCEQPVVLGGRRGGVRSSGMEALEQPVGSPLNPTIMLMTGARDPAPGRLPVLLGPALGAEVEDGRRAGPGPRPVSGRRWPTGAAPRGRSWAGLPGREEPLDLDAGGLALVVGEVELDQQQLEAIADEPGRVAADLAGGRPLHPELFHRLLALALAPFPVGPLGVVGG